MAPVTRRFRKWVSDRATLLFIIGGSSGIELGTVRSFHAEGYAVIKLSRRRCPNDEVPHITCDLSKPAFYEQVGEALKSALTTATFITLIHVASRLEDDSVVDTPSTRLSEVLAGNITQRTRLIRRSFRPCGRARPPVMWAARCPKKRCPAVIPMWSLSMTLLNVVGITRFI